MVKTLAFLFNDSMFIRWPCVTPIHTINTCFYLQAEARKLYCEKKNLDSHGKPLPEPTEEDGLEGDGVLSQGSVVSTSSQQSVTSRASQAASSTSNDRPLFHIGTAEGDGDEDVIPDVCPFVELHAEIDRFFKKKRTQGDVNLKSLDEFDDLGDGILRDLYVKYNTRMAASAVSERIFSTCSHVFTKNRTRLGDFLGELVFLKCNWRLVAYLEARKLTKKREARNRNQLKK